jgi:hypothetical protein
MCSSMLPSRMAVGGGDATNERQRGDATHERQREIHGTLKLMYHVYDSGLESLIRTALVSQSIVLGASRDSA